MGLKWKGLSSDDVATEFYASDNYTRRESRKELLKGAKEIMAASMEMAPVDDGQLEEAHQLAQLRLNRNFMEVEITVGGMVDGVNVDEYAWIQHERLEPAPGADMKRGPKSRDKNDSAAPGREVGGKFLERAIEQLEPIILARVASILPGS